MSDDKVDDFEPLIALSAPPSLPPGAVRGGSGYGLSFEIDWEAHPHPSHAFLLLAVNGEAVWDSADVGLAVDMGLLLDFMASHWDDIVLDESYPCGVTPTWPSKLKQELENRRANGMKLSQDQIDFHVQNFGLRHNLGNILLGSGARPLWLIREGNLMVIDARDVQHRWSFTDVIRTLTSLGDAVVKRANAKGWHRKGFADVVHKWSERDSAPSMANFGLRMGMSVEKTDYLVSRKVVPFPKSRAELARGLDEIKMAARMLSHFVSNADIEAVLKPLASIGKLSTEKLDDLSVEALAFLGTPSELSGVQPAVQGERLALWFRNRLGMNHPGEAVDPDKILADWGVELRDIELAPRIEAISVWGPKHGPCVLLNRNGVHAGAGWHPLLENGGARATLAHEICHLLVDRGRSLPVAEVLGGMTPRVPEQRANAFAAEFLVPQQWAIGVYNNVENAEAAVDTITRTYRVTRKLAAMQMINYDMKHTGALRERDRALLRNL